MRWLLAFVLLLAACKSSPGDKCIGVRTECYDERTQLVCQAGAFSLEPCKGPGGCKKAGEGTTCDVRGNADGDSCVTALDEKSWCSVDDKEVITCTKGSFRRVPCYAEKGCEYTGGVALCREKAGFFAPPGAPCVEAQKGLVGCSIDRKSLVRCDGGKIVAVESCAGKGACSMKSKDGGDAMPVCDVVSESGVGTQSAGDPCTSYTPGNRCSASGKEVLVCRAEKGKLEKLEACTGPSGCTQKGAFFYCDIGPRADGDACGLQFDATCDAANKKMLECLDGQWRWAADCANGCVRVQGKVACDIEADVGGKCNTTRRVCDRKKKSVLSCFQNKWQLDAECDHRCEMTNGTGWCAKPSP